MDCSKSKQMMGGAMEQEPNNPAEPDRPDTPTLTEIRSWPATVSVRMAAAAFGISTSHAYELITRGEFPAKVLRLGTRRRVVVTESILNTLSEEGFIEDRTPRIR